VFIAVSLKRTREIANEASRRAREHRPGDFSSYLQVEGQDRIGAMPDLRKIIEGFL
jgi:hypothetical protein